MRIIANYFLFLPFTKFSLTNSPASHEIETLKKFQIQQGF